MGKYDLLKECVACKESNYLREYLDFGLQPLANSYHHGVRLPHYPLAVQYCSNCSHSQLTASVDPKEMFEHYLYISDTSQTLTEYFESMCEKILNRNQNKQLSVFEIACNSGLFLEMFAQKGANCLGIDPAANLRELSRKRKLDVIVDFWNEKTAAEVAEANSFDIVMAIHVLPHVPDPVSFLAWCKKVLKPDGKIYIQTSQCNMFLNNEFDAIYHEHVSYFTALSFGRMAKTLGFQITGAWKAPIHSMCFVFELSIEGEDCDEYKAMILEEIQLNRNSFDSYLGFAKNANKIKEDLLNQIAYFKSQNMKVIGYGASAKGNTLLNWLNKKLDYIVDDNSLKWGYLTPGMDIPISSPTQLYQEKNPVAIVCLAWNFYDEIHNNVLKNTDISHKFIKYFPCVEVVD
jgi:2-polyprenyl-3-methyl-5-hydroxy-6-metoxy-1,4-benzoquinol methylase